jgi:4-alpha-glucanotransferase
LSEQGDASKHRAHALATRASGILLHVTSLPSPLGIGDLGPDAYRWIDFLARARQRWWQVLPIGPVAAGGANSPYRPASAFAGNPLLISPALLVEDGWLDAEELAGPAISPGLAHGRVDYDAVDRVRTAWLDRACRRFLEHGRHDAFDAFCDRHAFWLVPFARFRAAATSSVAPEDAVRREMCMQFFFEEQWSRLRAYAHERGVRIFGDLPFYVDEHSADVRHQPHLFKLDEDGRPRFLAGVPPDAFSATGQLWGNPVYDWDAHARDGFSWWVARIRRSLEWFDMVRLDHFRAFAAHWEVPAGNATAMNGAWVEGPGRRLLDAVASACPVTSLVAEDLGIITDDVRALMHAYDLPGMKVLLFAFDGDTGCNDHALHHHHPHAIVYTGTHDNNTARGWFEEDADDGVRPRLSRYLGRECAAAEVSDSLVRMAMMSVCNLAILPMQDLLGLDGSARMNRPSSSHGNWEWRLEPGALTPELAQRLTGLMEAYGRV